MKIIYSTPDGGIAIIHPTGDLPIDTVAAKDVPAGVPYKIVEDDAIPADRTYRNAWESNIENPDGVGAEYGAGTPWAVVTYGKDGFADLVRHEKTGKEKRFQKDES